MTELAFESVSYTVVETGKEIRRALRLAFPGVKFSLRGSRGTGYGWFSLSWTDGPTASQVDAITNGFRSSYFDGMDDSTHQIPATMYADDDGVIRERRFACHGVNTQRDYSDAATMWACDYVDSHGGLEVFDPYARNNYGTAVHRLFSGVDMVGIDWATVPAPGGAFSGRHVPSSYCLETRVDAYSAGYSARHMVGAGA